jgi:hypothetical protein
MRFLGGWRPRKGLPRNQLFILAIEGCQDNIFTWRLRAAPLLGGSSLPRKAINLAVK